MKKLLLLTAGLLLFISCSNDDSNSTNNSNTEIVGSWELYKIVLDDGSEITDVTDDYSTYIFDSNGTGVYTISGAGANGEVQGTWDYVNSKYRFNGDDLNLIDVNTFWKESAIIGETDYYRRFISPQGITGDDRLHVGMNMTYGEIRDELEAGGLNNKWFCNKRIVLDGQYAGQEQGSNYSTIQFTYDDYGSPSYLKNEGGVQDNNPYGYSLGVEDNNGDLSNIFNHFNGFSVEFSFYSENGEVRFYLVAEENGITKEWHFIKD